jgi:hypothetical protein
LGEWWQEAPTTNFRKKKMTSPAAPLCLVFVDLTTSATPDAMRPASYMQAIIDAVTEQVNGPFAAEWGTTPMSMRIGSGPTDRGATEIAVNFRDTLDVQGALAYHATVNGVPDIEVGVDLFESAIVGQESVACGVSHEILEMARDLGANGWKDRQDSTGLSDAEEMCDFVQNTSYPANNGATMSNFVTKAFFVPGSAGPWDYLGVMTSQRDVSHGYGIVEQSQTTTSQIDGFKYASLHKTLNGRFIFTIGELTDKQKRRKDHEHSRAYRRGARV